MYRICVARVSLGSAYDNTRLNQEMITTVYLCHSFVLAGKRTLVTPSNVQKLANTLKYPQVTLIEYCTIRRGKKIYIVTLD